MVVCEYNSVVLLLLCTSYLRVRKEKRHALAAIWTVDFIRNFFSSFFGKFTLKYAEGSSV